MSVSDSLAEAYRHCLLSLPSQATFKPVLQPQDPKASSKPLNTYNPRFNQLVYVHIGLGGLSTQPYVDVN